VVAAAKPSLGTLCGADDVLGLGLGRASWLTWGYADLRVAVYHVFDANSTLPDLSRRELHLGELPSDRLSESSGEKGWEYDDSERNNFHVRSLAVRSCENIPPKVRSVSGRELNIQVDIWTN
jgi:hypothetical protein